MNGTAKHLSILGGIIGGAALATAVAVGMADNLHSPLNEQHVKESVRQKLGLPAANNANSCYYVVPEAKIPVSFSPNTKNPVKDAVVLFTTFGRVQAVEDGKTLLPKSYSAPLGELPVLKSADCLTLREDWKMTQEQAVALIEKTTNDFVAQAIQTPGYRAWEGRKGWIRYDR